MAFYENTIIAKQDLASKEIELIKKKYNELINNSSGRCLMTMERIPKDVITERYNYGFKLGLMKKDVVTAINIIGEDNKMFNNIKKIMEKAVEEMGYDADYTEISKLF